MSIKHKIDVSHIMAQYGIKLPSFTLWSSMKRLQRPTTLSTPILYIDPPEEAKAQEPINDELTQLMQDLLNKAEVVDSQYKEVHTCDDGTKSNGRDYFFMIDDVRYQTNSLAVYYLQYYRDSIPENELALITTWLNT